VCKKASALNELSSAWVDWNGTEHSWRLLRGRILRLGDKAKTMPIQKFRGAASNHIRALVDYIFWRSNLNTTPGMPHYDTAAECNVGLK
jgi:hypothetical protein